jgi:hypothetical protein
MKKYKCSKCLLIIQEDDLVDGCCPVCKTDDMLKPMCPNDRICSCAEEIIETIAYCELCGAPCCPVCGSEDVSQLSRVTGYLSDVGGWGAGKRQELKDRQRYDVAVNR